MSVSRPIASAMLGLIGLYRLTLSPLLGGQCRYLPTCSCYAEEAIRAHGAWKGGWMALARLQRCRPLGGSGWDPAPAEAPRAPWWAPWRYGDWRGGYRSSPVNGGGLERSEGEGASDISPSVRFADSSPAGGGAG